MIKVILDKKDLKLIETKLENDPIIQTTLEDDQIALIVDDLSYERIEKILKKITVSRKEVVFETHSGWVRLYIGDILYIESFGSQIIIHTIKNGNISIKQTLYQLEKILANFHIIRIGKSFLVNLSKVVYIHSRMNAKLALELVGGIKLEVTRSFVKSFKNALGIGGVK